MHFPSDNKFTPEQHLNEGYIYLLSPALATKKKHYHFPLRSSLSVFKISDYRFAMWLNCDLLTNFFSHTSLILNLFLRPIFFRSLGVSEF